MKTSNQGSPGLIDLPKPPWQHEAMRELLDLFLNAYNTTGAARHLADVAGLDLARWNPAQAPQQAWIDLLGVSMEQGGLARLLAQALADPHVRAFHEKLRAFEQLRISVESNPGAASANREPRQPSSSGPASLPQSASELRVPQFHYGGVVPPSYFIGRVEELEMVEELVRSRQNFLLVGERRAGKTSFCETLIHRVMSRPGNDVLVGKLNLESCQNLTLLRRRSVRQSATCPQGRSALR